MSNPIEEKPKDGDKIFTEEEIKFLAQVKIRSKILQVLKENFNVEENLLVISEKKEDE